MFQEVGPELNMSVLGPPTYININSRFCAFTLCLYCINNKFEPRMNSSVCILICCVLTWCLYSGHRWCCQELTKMSLLRQRLHLFQNRSKPQTQPVLPQEQQIQNLLSNRKLPYSIRWITTVVTLFRNNLSAFNKVFQTFADIAVYVIWAQCCLSSH